MSLEGYDALNETAYLLHRPRDTKRLLESIEELEKRSRDQACLWLNCKALYIFLYPGKQFFQH